MRRLALAALLATVGGCSALLGIDDVVTSTTPDSPLASCPVASSFQLLQASDGDQGAGVEVDADGSIFFALRLNLDKNSDIMGLWLRPGMGAFHGALVEGSYTIAGDDAKFATCGVCAFIAVDFDLAHGSATDFYIATGGTVMITNVHSRLQASLQDVSFAHIDLATGNVIDTCTSHVQGVSINFALPTPDAGVPDARVNPPDARPTPDAGPPAPDAPFADAGPPDASVTVTGSVIYNYINTNDASQTTAPYSLLTSTVQGLVPEGSGFTTYPAVARADGTFTIAGLPAVPRYVRVNRVFLFTPALVTDFGDNILGRSDTVTVPNDSHDFAVDLSNAEAAMDGDFFEIFSPNLDLLFTLDADVGATTFAQSMYFTRAVEAAKGDRVIVTELNTRTSSLGEPYRALSHFVTLPSFSTVGGTTVDVPAATFAAVAQTGTATIDWLRTQFQAARADVNPAAAYLDDSLYLFAMAGNKAADLYSSTAPDLFSTGRDTAADTHFGTVHFGNPYPAAWNVWSYHVTRFNLSLSAPGATTPADVHGFLTRIDALPALASPIVPSLTPVTAPTIEGRDAFVAQSGVGPMPTFAWGPPKKGTPDGYIVYLYELTNVSGTSTSTFVASLYTGGKTLKVPPGLLANGHTYYAYITAFLAPNAKIAQAPYRRGMPNAYADVVTATFTP